MVFLSPVGQFQGNSQFQLPAGRGGAAGGWQRPDLLNGGQCQHNLFFSRL